MYMYMIMTQDETQIQMFTDRSMSHAKRVTVNNSAKLRASLHPKQFQAFRLRFFSGEFKNLFAWSCRRARNKRLKGT